MRHFRPGHTLAFALATALASVLVFAAPAVFADEDSKEESKDESKDKDKDRSESKEEAKAEGSVSLSPKGKKLGGTTDADSDHALYVGAFALGYLGASEIPFIQSATVGPGANNTVRLDATPTTINAPVIGMRYWISDLLGLDVGVGFRNYSGKVKQHIADLTPGQELETNIEQKDINQFGMMIHAGVPLALHAEKHWVFQVIPELNIGFSNGKMVDPAKGQYVPPNATPTYMNDVKFSGLRFDVGARAGAELHFGFIGVPNLSLQATVGLYLRYDSYKAKGGGSPGTTPSWPDTLSYERSNTTLGTSVQDAPWSIFTKTVSALYYF